LALWSSDGMLQTVFRIVTIENPIDKELGYVGSVVVAHSVLEDEAAPGRFVVAACAFALHLGGRHSHSPSPWVDPAALLVEIDRSDCDMNLEEIALDEALRRPIRRVPALLDSLLNVSMGPRLVQPLHRRRHRWVRRPH
jgi:hypothetical protein